MIYFSELKGRKICTEDDVEVGRLNDLIFLAIDKPKVTKLVVCDKQKNNLIIPLNHLKKINHSLVIEKSYTFSPLKENELYVLRNLLDKQIIDLKGNKIVRVNDVAFQQNILNDCLELYVVGVDVGILGILRWIKVEELIKIILDVFRIKISSTFLSWSDIAPLELTRGKVQLKKKEDKLQKIRPEDLADYLERTNVINARKFLRLLDNKKAAEVIGNLNIDYQHDLFKYYRPEKTVEILNLIDPDEAVDALLTLSENKRQQIIQQLPEKKKREFNYLINLSATSIGKLLTTEYLTVSPNSLVKEVIVRIKAETTDFSFLTPIFVVNKEKKIIGVFNLHELLLQDLNTTVYKFMIQNVIVIHLTTPTLVAINKAIKYKLTVLPVVDGQRRVIGVISIIRLVDSIIKKI